MAFSTINKSSLYQNNVLYTGNSSYGHGITGVGFQPDLVWIKKRNAIGDHELYDAVRGTDKAIETNTEDGERTAVNLLHSFDADGFTVDDHGIINSVNTFVAWNWKAGTAVSGATTGSGTAKTYTGSKNTTAGFSIIKYVGNGTAGHTIPHELGAIPDMITVKNLTTGSTHWRSIFPNVNTANYNLNLNQTNPWNDGTEFNDTMPTTSVFTVATSGDVNTNDSSYIAYCWKNVAGYSKFSSFSGNGNVDGTFIQTNFKPSWLLVKRTDSTGAWMLIDNKRLGYNDENRDFKINDTIAERDVDQADILSNGFKVRTTSSDWNTSGGTYIYMAFGQPIISNSGVCATAR